MQRRLQAFAGEYDAEADKQAYESDGQRSINHPLVFVFIGDKCLDALSAVYELNETKWHNSKGVVYLHLYSERTVERDNVFGIRLPALSTDRKTARPQLYRQFYDDVPKLQELNRVVRQVSGRLGEFGSMYASFQQMNMAVVTNAHDTCNVVLQEVTLLLRKVLSESFKQIQIDLYALIREKHDDGDYEYAASATVAFLRELDYYQKRSYSFSAPLQVTEDQIRLPVEHMNAPLFDLVYLLSDKNERGMFVDRSMETNYEIICSISLLKNRKVVGEFDHKLEAYNNQRFRQHIAPAHMQGNVYATAGFSKVKRPNRAIALTVLHHLTQHVIGRLKEQSEADRKTVMDIWQADDASIERKAEALVPDKEKLEEMNALLFSTVSYGELKRLTLAEAEQWMYGRHAGEFFREQFTAKANRMLEQLDLERELAQATEQNVIGSPQLGLYCAYIWTSEKDDAVVYQELRKWMKETAKQLEDGQLKLAQWLQETVDMQPFRRVPFMPKSTLKHFSRFFFEHIYGKRLELLRLETKLALLKRYEAAFARIHEQVKAPVERLFELEKQVREAHRQSVSEANDYLGRNISEYYASVVDRIVKELQSKRGDEFLFDERFVGNVASHLESGTETLLQRLIDVCKKQLFPYAPFRQSFEDELIQRANVTVRFDDKDNVLSKEQLYRDLFDTLKEEAAVHIEVYNYTQQHRYEEHYFFGDSESDFIRYAFAADKGNRPYMLGCVHENKNSGIEKLSMMGGFRIDDLLLYRNGKTYYDSYRSNGFQFHAIRLDEPVN